MNSSVNGKKYELEVFNVVKKCKLNDKFFNIQKENELGGSSNKNDIECNLNQLKDIPIEIKKIKTPDWMQCSLKYDNINNKWIGSLNNKIPNNSKKIFEDILSYKILFNKKIPPFMIEKITHEEWLKIKKETNDFKDTYIDCPNDTIKKLYYEKGCKYIQISEKGLYHLGNDLCNFNVVEFICEQQLRIRTKIHTRKDKSGFCKLSVTVSCLPKNINKLVNSKYSLDNINKLPNNLIYINDIENISNKCIIDFDKLIEILLLDNNFTLCIIKKELGRVNSPKILYKDFLNKLKQHFHNTNNDILISMIKRKNIELSKMKVHQLFNIKEENITEKEIYKWNKLKYYNFFLNIKIGNYQINNWMKQISM
jgi:hypothetical protein